MTNELTENQILHQTASKLSVNYITKTMQQENAFDVSWPVRDALQFSIFQIHITQLYEIQYKQDLPKDKQITETI